MTSVIATKAFRPLLRASSRNVCLPGNPGIYNSKLNWRSGPNWSPQTPNGPWHANFASVQKHSSTTTSKTVENDDDDQQINYSVKELIKKMDNQIQNMNTEHMAIRKEFVDAYSSANRQTTAFSRQTTAFSFVGCLLVIVIFVHGLMGNNKN